MADLILQNNSVSPFDAIRREDVDGEYWLGRELMPILGYVRWSDFDDVIERAKAACKNAENSLLEHFSGTILKSTGGRPKQDCRLSRYACYLVAQNGDPRKPEVAAAQSYFAVKTREAETIIPIQSDRLRELELENENLRLKSSLVSIHGKELALLLMGHKDQIVQTDRPILEVVNQTTGRHFSGQTCKQVAEYVQKRTGKKLKSGAEVERVIRALGRDDLIYYVERPTKQACIPKEKLPEVYWLLSVGDRQRLIGE